jgi:hypothetical protein
MFVASSAEGFILAIAIGRHNRLKGRIGFQLMYPAYAIAASRRDFDIAKPSRD